MLSCCEARWLRPAKRIVLKHLVDVDYALAMKIASDLAGRFKNSALGLRLYSSWQITRNAPSIAAVSNDWPILASWYSARVCKAPSSSAEIVVFTFFSNRKASNQLPPGQLVETI